MKYAKTKHQQQQKQINKCATHIQSDTHTYTFMHNWSNDVWISAWWTFLPLPSMESKRFLGTNRHTCALTYILYIAYMYNWRNINMRAKIEIWKSCCCCCCCLIRFHLCHRQISTNYNNPLRMGECVCVCVRFFAFGCAHLAIVPSQGKCHATPVNDHQDPAVYLI